MTNEQILLLLGFVSGLVTIKPIMKFSIRININKQIALTVTINITIK